MRRNLAFVTQSSKFTGDAPFMSQYIPVMEKTNSLLKLHNRCPFTGVKSLGVRPPLRGQGHLKICYPESRLWTLPRKAERNVQN